MCVRVCVCVYTHTHTIDCGLKINNDKIRKKSCVYNGICIYIDWLLHTRSTVTSTRDVHMGVINYCQNLN